MLDSLSILPVAENFSNSPRFSLASLRLTVSAILRLAVLMFATIFSSCVHRGLVQKASGHRRRDMSAGHPGHGRSRGVQVSSWGLVGGRVRPRVVITGQSWG